MKAYFINQREIGAIYFDQEFREGIRIEAKRLGIEFKDHLNREDSVLGNFGETVLNGNHFVVKDK